MKVKIDVTNMGKDSFGSNITSWLSWPIENSIEETFLKMADKFKTYPVGTKFVITTEA